jgi:hypothetical protein
MTKSYGGFTSLAFLAALAPVVANAAPCDTSKPIVVIRGSSASEPVLNAIGPIAATNGINIVYSSADSSCGGGVASIFGATPPKTTSGKTKYATDKNGTCDLDADTVADIGVSDVYAQSCTTISPAITSVPDTIEDYLGPVQAFTLIVHDDPSYPVAISQEAAYNIFGVTARGGNAQFAVAPWTVQADIFARNAGSGTQQTWWRALDLPSVDKFGGVDQGGSGALLSAVSEAARASVIGILAYNDIVTPAGGTPPAVRPLAYQAKGQTAAYYPNSTATATDLANVRDGHYLPWASLHFFAKKTNGALSANVQAVLDLLESQEVVEAEANAHVVPQCAMKVSRTSDQGDLSNYTPEKPCGNFFEATITGQAPADAVACTADSGCAADQQCVFGYCEVK